MTLDEFLARRESDQRLARLTHDVALPRPVGLEIGPGDSPLALPDGFVGGYVDYKPREAASPLLETIPYIVWSGAGALAPLCPRSNYDFVVAVQVAQYVPNLLGWFRGIFDVLRPGGVLNLALPDRRFTFDVKRHASTLGELLEAFEADYARPSPRQIFDHTHLAVAATTEQLWDGETAVDALTPLCGSYALQLAEQALQQGRDAYVECHCWVFTPLSFLALVEGASRLGLFPFVVSQFAATEVSSFEFHVCLRRDGESDPAALLRLQLGAIDHVRSIHQRRQRVISAALRE